MIFCIRRSLRFEKGEWLPRKRRVSPFTLSRLYIVNPRDVERFHLRLLLLHVRGATSFEFLRTVEINGISTVYDTFQEACRARGLVADDNQWRETLPEAAVSQMPKQLRSMLAFLLVFCDVSDGRALFEEFKAVFPLM